LDVERKRLTNPDVCTIGNKDTQVKAYELLCDSYHAIDSFRSQLLGFLPLASGGLLLLVADKLSVPSKESTSAALDWANPILPALGLFGFVVTFGLSIFEAYGIRRCTALIMAGKRLEASLCLDDGVGQFRRRPDHCLNEPLASGVVYGAVLAAWAYVGLRGLWQGESWIWIAGPLAVLGAAVVAGKWTQCSAEKRERAYDVAKKGPLVGERAGHGSCQLSRRS
jgi:hypothetical protein